MNKKIYEMHAEICKVFTSPKRLEIISLGQNNVVSTRRDGANIYYKIANPKILHACDLMREVLLEKLAENEKFAKRML